RPLASVAGAPRLARRTIDRRTRERAGTALSLGFVTAYLTAIVALPIAALVWASRNHDGTSFWQSISNPEAVAALKLTLAIAALVAITNALFGTMIGWTLVRDQFPGKSVV